MNKLKSFQEFEHLKESEAPVTTDLNEAMLPELLSIWNDFMSWMNSGHKDMAGEVVKNWEVVIGVLTAILGVGGSFFAAYRKAQKEEKEAAKEAVMNAITQGIKDKKEKTEIVKAAEEAAKQVMN